MKKKKRGNKIRVWKDNEATPIEDMMVLVRYERSKRGKKCFRVNSCKYIEHGFECETCYFYRKKIG